MAVASGRIAAPPAAFASGSRWRSRPAQVGAVLALMLVGYFLLKGEYPWPTSLTWQELPAKLDDLQSWLLDERTAENPNVIFAILDGFRSLAEWLVTALDNMLLWLTWVGTIASGTLIVLRFGGWRAALITFFAFVSFAVMGLWEESMQTLALMSAAVMLSLAVGIPFGILAGRSERFHRSITPALDAMQIVPAFAYLMPVVILFSVGPAAAVICTMIYAIPPAVRITALGIRGVTGDSVEAARAFGATSAQTLFKVQLPLARRQLLLSVNQTIMFALSLVVIAGLIGGKGLGDVVTNGLYSNAALAILAGIAIVIMAIALDRATSAIAERTDPTRRHLTDRGKRRNRMLTAATFAAILAIVFLARALGADSIYPDEFETATTVYTATINEDLLRWIQSALDYVQDPTSFIFGITEPIGNFLLEYLLEPLRKFLVDSPWFIVLGGLTAIAFVLSGLRPAITASADARGDRRDGRLAGGDGHRLAGARGHRARRPVRHRDRRLGGGEPARGAAAAAAARHAPDASAARLHHPVHLPDAGLADTGRGGVRALRDPGGDPARDERRARRAAGGRGGGLRVRGVADAGAGQGEGAARPRDRSCSASTRGSSWSSRWS